MLSPLDREYRLMLENRIPLNQNMTRYKSEIFLNSTRVCLQDLFRVLINVEVRVETLRQRLNRLPRFNSRLIYEQIDRLNKGYILDTDVKKFFLKN